MIEVMKKFLQLIGFVILISPFWATAQERQSLQECIKTALDNNLRVKRGVYNSESFKLSLLQNKMSFLPTLNGTGTLGRSYGRTVDPVTYAYYQGSIQTFSPSLNSSWTLFNGLRFQNLYRQGKKDLEAADQDLLKAKNDVILNVVTNYMNVILNKELLENAKYQLNSSEQQVSRIRKQVDAGSLPKSNLLNQEAQVASNELSVINQENSLNVSLLQLKQAMQVPATSSLDIVIPDLALEDLVIDQTPEDVYKLSLASMPEVKSALLKVESAQLALKASRGNLYPRLTLNSSANSNYSSSSETRVTRGLDGTYTTTKIGYVNTGSGVADVFYDSPNTTTVIGNYGPASQLNDNLSKNFNLSLSIPIFNGLQTNVAVQRAAINRELANITVKETENTLRQSIETAFNDAISASRSYNASLKQANAREEAYRVTKQRLDAGGANFVEYQVSENDFYAAKSDLARAKYNFIFRKKLLDFYQGKQLDL